MIRERYCFVVSPIGKEGTDLHRRFREVLDEVIQPAFSAARLKIKVIRADDIQRPGAFIRDILELLASAYLVIADLTGQNPNVFYELGVRHALSPRTILIAQSSDDIPSDLRGYRTIVYGTSPGEIAEFKRSIRQFLRQIEVDPERPDNPVLDALKHLVPAIPDDLRQSFAARRMSIGKKQDKLLRYLEKRTLETGQSVAQEEIADRFKRRFELSKGSEIYYRLEHLRLLGFLIKEQDEDSDSYRYRLSPAYRREIGRGP